ncbi:hypothetical protein NUU61_007620 [Penicillium alfredii]|uniref:Uncharacterized protein n=1 Tax=Penicillium alfredii TaxID=1506179 RepID=A0A9W9EQT7_9EURO|nr:uncharacterized protein NUU61_007620 [Penicillium alfredii]KAJ5086313.1 hypothetical protein NUU61_007620 [Penicillium alfredii]
MGASAQAIQQADRLAVIHAYRHLYRQGLKAIRYSTPARHVLVNSLRASFRSSPQEELNPSKISNTLRFLERAAETTGMEHKIVRNLMLARFWERPQIAKESRILRSLGLGKEEHQLRKGAYEHFNSTLTRDSSTSILTSETNPIRSTESCIR